MSEETNYPVATVPAQAAADTCPTMPPVVRLQHSEAEEEFLNNLYAQLKPEAVGVYVQYFLARTPGHLQMDMKDLLKADLETPPSVPPEALATSPVTEQPASPVTEQPA